MYLNNSTVSIGETADPAAGKGDEGHIHQVHKVEAEGVRDGAGVG